jgi:hypothetical protein
MSLLPPQTGPHVLLLLSLIVLLLTLIVLIGLLLLGLIFLPVLLLNAMVLNRPLTKKGPVVQESAVSCVPFFGYCGSNW